MSPSLEDWVERLKNKPLPAMALTVQRVTKLLDGSSTTNADYERVISRDPGFSLALFHAFSNANTANKAPPSSLSHAIAMLGVGPIINAKKELPILKKMLHGSARQGLYGCYSRATHAASYLYQWGKDRSDSNPEELAIAALLRNCGEMALWAYAKEEMKKVVLLMSRRQSFQSAGKRIFGFTIDELNQAMAEQWRLPQIAQDSLHPYGAFQPRSLGLMLATELAFESEKDWFSGSTEELLELVGEYTKLDTNDAVAYVHRQAVDTARAIEGLPIPISAPMLIQVPYQSVPVSNEVAAEKTQNQQPADQAHPSQKADRPKTKPKESNPPQPEESKRKPQIENEARPKENRPPSLQEKLADVIRNLKDNSGLDRIMFAMVTPDRKAIRARIVAGKDPERGLHKLEIDLQQKHLFSILVAKQQGFWLNQDNHQKYAPLIPKELRIHLNPDSFFVTSLYVRNKLLGILYADCEDPTELDSNKFSYFKQLSQRLCNELSAQ